MLRNAAVLHFAVMIPVRGLNKFELIDAVRDPYNDQVAIDSIKERVKVFWLFCFLALRKGECEELCLLLIALNGTTCGTECHLRLLCCVDIF